MVAKADAVVVALAHRPTIPQLMIKHLRQEMTRQRTIRHRQRMKRRPNLARKAQTQWLLPMVTALSNSSLLWHQVFLAYHRVAANN